MYDLLIKLFLLRFGGERKFRLAMLKGIEFTAGEKVLDLCCGTGGLTLIIREKAGPGVEITGVDLSPRQIKRARKKNKYDNIRFILSDASSTGLPAGSFDKVFIGHALHEMDHTTRLAVIGEARRLLKSGGSLYILEFDLQASLWKRLLFEFSLGYWIPHPINYENRTMRNMFKHGVLNEVREEGFIETRKISRFSGTMQVVVAVKG